MASSVQVRALTTQRPSWCKHLTAAGTLAVMVQGKGIHLEALGDDAGLGALASGKVLVQSVDEPCPELQHVPLLLYGEALVAAAHHCLHELVGADLHHHHHQHDKPYCFRLRYWAGSGLSVVFQCTAPK